MEIKYQLPFPKKIKKRVVKPSGLYAHQKSPICRYAIDFLLPVGTPILATRAGRVVKIKDDSDKWGLNLKYANEVNFVGIDHGDGTFAEYLHFGKKKIVLKLGDKVKAGDLLGYSGLSGCMDLPHLHFNVFKIENNKPVSIRVKFTKK